MKKYPKYKIFNIADREKVLGFLNETKIKKINDKEIHFKNIGLINLNKF